MLRTRWGGARQAWPWDPTVTPQRQVAADAVGWSQEHLEEAAKQAKAGMKHIMDVARQKGEPAADALKTA